LPMDFIAATLSFLPHWLPRPLLHLTLYFSCPRSTGSRRHHRPRRSTWEQWWWVRSKLWPRSPLRRHHQASSTLRRWSMLSNHRWWALGEHRTTPANPSLAVDLTSLSWRQRTEAIHIHLIERRSMPHTDSVPNAADWPSPPVSCSNWPRHIGSGPAHHLAA
jgi:hypothetical protein